MARFYSEIVIVFEKELKIFRVVAIIIPRSRSNYRSLEAKKVEELIKILADASNSLVVKRAS